MTRAADRQRRVLAVRCPAWQPPAPADRAQRRPGDSAPGPEARAFEPVVSAVQEFCPRIEVVRPGICAFSAREPARYFGGEAELARKVTEAVSRLGFDCGVGIADGMFAALLASRDGPVASQARIVPSGGTPAFLAPRSVTVAAQTCLEAGMIATLAMLQGRKAETFLQREGAKAWCIR